MPFYEITITGSKQFFVEADTEDEALDHEIVNNEMETMTGNIDWEADTVFANSEDKAPDLEQCKRHGLKVFDKEGIEYSV